MTSVAWIEGSWDYTQVYFYVGETLQEQLTQCVKDALKRYMDEDGNLSDFPKLETYFSGKTECSFENILEFYVGILTNNSEILDSEPSGDRGKYISVSVCHDGNWWDHFTKMGIDRDYVTMKLLNLSTGKMKYLLEN